VEDPGPNLSCGYYEVPMDYFDSAAGKARLAVAKYQATVPNKKGTLFLNPGAITTYAGLDATTSYVETLQVDLGGLVFGSCLSWEPISARASKDSTTSSLGTLAASVRTRCEFFLPMI